MKAESGRPGVDLKEHHWFQTVGCFEARTRYPPLALIDFAKFRPGAILPSNSSRSTYPVAHEVSFCWPLHLSWENNSAYLEGSLKYLGHAKVQALIPVTTGRCHGQNPHQLGGLSRYSWGFIHPTLACHHPLFLGANFYAVTYALCASTDVSNLATLFGTDSNGRQIQNQGRKREPKLVLTHSRPAHVWVGTQATINADMKDMTTNKGAASDETGDH